MHRDVFFLLNMSFVKNTMLYYLFQIALLVAPFEERRNIGRRFAQEFIFRCQGTGNGVYGRRPKVRIFTAFQYNIMQIRIIIIY